MDEFCEITPKKGKKFSSTIASGIVVLMGAVLYHISSAGNSITGQDLPIGARLIQNGEIINLEVAGTEEQREIGLMGRRDLDDDRGMLFVFDGHQNIKFWMKDTYIPLDMIFLDGDRVIGIIANVPPCRSDPCPAYGIAQEFDRVIELRAGRAGELGLKKGKELKLKINRKT